MTQSPLRLVIAAIAEYRSRHGVLHAVVVPREMYAALCEEMYDRQDTVPTDQSGMFVCGVPVIMEADEGERLQ